MLAYILALAVAVGSIAIYMVAFLFPKIHRKNDFIWSGVGLFYALVLWIFASKITGGLLLGHIASVTLITWFAWQTMTLRQQVPIPAPTTDPTTAESPSNSPQPLAQITSGLSGIVTGITSRFQKNQPQPQDTKRAETTPASTAVERLRNVQDESVAQISTETPTVVETQPTVETQSNATTETVKATDVSVAPFPEETAVSTTVESPSSTVNDPISSPEAEVNGTTPEMNETTSQENPVPSDVSDTSTEENPPTPPAS